MNAARPTAELVAPVRALASRAAESWWREVALLSLRRSRPFCEAFFREMLAAGIAEEHPDLADRCLSEALFFSAVPFLETLDKAESPRRVAAVLRLLRDRAGQVPELAEIARRLAAAEDREIRSMAVEILGRVGVILPQAVDEQKVSVLEEVQGHPAGLGAFLRGAQKDLEQTVEEELPDDEVGNAQASRVVAERQ